MALASAAQIQTDRRMQFPTDIKPDNLEEISDFIKDRLGVDTVGEKLEELIITRTRKTMGLGPRDSPRAWKPRRLR